MATQTELIAAALEREEGNVQEHLNYLIMEEDKRQRAKVIRTAVSGPLLRFISCTEDTLDITTSLVADHTAHQLEKLSYGDPSTSALENIGQLVRAAVCNASQC